MQYITIQTGRQVFDPRPPILESVDIGNRELGNIGTSGFKNKRNNRVFKQPEQQDYFHVFCLFLSLLRLLPFCLDQKAIPQSGDGQMRRDDDGEL